MSFDLHVHSDISDGTENMEEILLKAKKIGLRGISFTNHDTVVGCDKAVSLGRKYRIEVIKGIEISAYDFDRKRKVHILGYGFIEGKAIDKACRDTRYRRNCNSLWQLRRLLEMGYEIDEVNVVRKSKSSGVLYKQHIMEELKEQGYTEKIYGNLYRELFKNNGPLAKDIDYISAMDAIRAIKEDGGIAVLAHPGELDSFEIIDELVEVGLDGIELNHPSNTEDDRKFIVKKAREYGLILTGGSDYHGRYGNSVLGQEVSTTQGVKILNNNLEVS